MGAPVGEVWEFPEFKNGKPFFGAKFSWFSGATAAYRTDLFSLIPSPKAKILIEDYPLAVLLHLLRKKVIVVHRPLVSYRLHDNNLSRPSSSHSVQLEKKKAEHRRRLADAIAYVLDTAAILSPTDGHTKINTAAALRRIEYLQLYSRWWELAPAEKVKFLLLSVREGKLRSALSRLFGMRVFLLRELARSYVSQLFGSSTGKQGSMTS